MSKKLNLNQNLKKNQEHSVYVVTMFPLRSVTVWQRCWPAEPRNSPPFECPWNGKKSENMSPPKEFSKLLLCASLWAWKWLSKCLLCWECVGCPKTSKSLKMSSKLKLNDWWNCPPLVPRLLSLEKGLLLIWSYSCLLLVSDRVSYAEEQNKVH